MIILAIETVTECCSVCVLTTDSSGEQATSRHEINPTGHSKVVLDMVSDCLKEAGVQLGEVDLIAVDSGPGSFTGLRIGIGVAQGLAYGAGKKVAVVSSLEALALPLIEQDPESVALPAIDARMGQVYWSLICRNNESAIGLKQLSEPAVSYPADVTVSVSAPNTLVGVGSGWDAYAHEIQQ
ncbi:MAG: tRNA (adenosine(37)-N6)-threonylcarbamoyltransferase complex dimerization subunit type 1 TsaB, partial [Pseudomonadota bacterium]